MHSFNERLYELEWAERRDKGKGEFAKANSEVHMWWREVRTQY